MRDGYEGSKEGGGALDEKDAEVTKVHIDRKSVV